MALQINSALTSNTGIVVPSGSYCWLIADFGNDFEYRVTVKMLFFKDKTAFDQRRSRFDPVQVPVDRLTQNYTPAQIGNIDYLDIHNAAKAYLEGILGVGTVAIVQ